MSFQASLACFSSWLPLRPWVATQNSRLSPSPLGDDYDQVPIPSAIDTPPCRLGVPQPVPVRGPRTSWTAYSRAT
jgi:hypothetical protein